MGDLLNIKDADKNKFKIDCKTATTAEIVIYSEIGENFWGEGVSARSFSEELKELPKSVSQIDVRLNSPGGDVFEGISIYNRLKQHSANVTVYVDGLAASIASIIALAGNEIILGEGALIMVHKPMTGIYGNSTEMETVIARLDDVEEQLVGIYKRRTGLDRSEIKSMLANETWIEAEKALELGFADKIMEEEDVIRVAASFDNCPWMNKSVKAKIGNGTYVKDKINKFKQDAEALLTR